MTRSAKKKHLTPLQVVALSLFSLMIFSIGISSINTASENRQPSEALFDNSQTVSLL